MSGVIIIETWKSRTKLNSFYRCFKTNINLVAKTELYPKRLIEAGNYFYAFSHIPWHEISLPENTFTITCVRNPVDRVLSHYKQLLYYKVNKIPRTDLEVEIGWLGNSFNDFLSNAPKEHLLRQVYMFSKEFNVEESFERIMNCSHLLFTEEFEIGVSDLCSKLDISLEPIHIRKSRISYNFSSAELERLTDILEPELSLYTKLRQARQE